MSSVTDVFIIVGDTFDIHAEDIAPKVAKAAYDHIFSVYSEADRSGTFPVISLMRDDWRTLQGGSKVAGSAVIWLGWNHATLAGPAELEDRLKAEGFTNITLWTHHENDSRDEIPPRVVSW